MLLSNDAIAAAIENCAAGGLLQAGPRPHLRGHHLAVQRGEPTDSVTVTDELRRSGLLEAVGDPSVFISLQANTPSIGNAEHYADIVEEHALLRRLVAVAGEIADLGYSVPEDVNGVARPGRELVFDVAQRRVVDTMRPLHDLLGAEPRPPRAALQPRRDITGLATGYTDLDEQLAGLQPSNLIVVGARPAMGKTSFALGMVANAGVQAAAAGPPVLPGDEPPGADPAPAVSEAQVDAQPHADRPAPRAGLAARSATPSAG